MNTNCGVVNMMEYTLFFSWQNDKKGVKKIIRNALSNAKTALQKENIRLILDEDTRGRVGNRDIVRAVLDKINKCDIFLADVTPVTTMYKNVKSHLPKHLPNSNVMFEYGYALHCKGEDRMITIAKMGRGEHVEFMPFDINHNTLTTFSDVEDLKNLAVWIKNIIEDVDKERATLIPDYACELTVSGTGIGKPVIRPQFKKTIFVIKKPEIQNEKLMAAVENLVGPAKRLQELTMGFSKPQIQIARTYTQKTNKSFCSMMLSFNNRGNTALENCNLTIEADDNQVKFARTNVENTMLSHIIMSSSTHIYDESVSFHVDILNPQDLTLTDSIYIHVPYDKESFKLLWKLSSKTYRAEGEIEIGVEPVFSVDYVENEKKAGTEVIEDLVEIE